MGISTHLVSSPFKLGYARLYHEHVYFNSHCFFSAHKPLTLLLNYYLYIYLKKRVRQLYLICNGKTNGYYTLWLLGTNLGHFICNNVRAHASCYSFACGMSNNCCVLFLFSVHAAKAWGPVARRLRQPRHRPTKSKSLRKKTTWSLFGRWRPWTRRTPFTFNGRPFDTCQKPIHVLSPDRIVTGINWWNIEWGGNMYKQCNVKNCKIKSQLRSMYTSIPLVAYS